MWGRARRGARQKNSFRPHRGSSIPLTSSSDSLCGTEKQLVTSTECLSTVPVRENGPVLCDLKAPNRLRPLSSSFQIFSHLGQDHHLNHMISQKLTCEPPTPMPAFTTNFYSGLITLFPLHMYFLTPPQLLAPRLLCFFLLPSQASCASLSTRDHNVAYTC